ncbi:N-acetylglucosamine-6-sulfatase isoform X2 [Nilaparvata lugens]|uniref:N-acetylglucosamine-6-sulfatase isoform X2 n=1 Tax=Nilaparvata lugens TaxID=108931 RepID=UPI000B983215|nr:N-acetylglucosamine-6-sulfatase isoform X2 [Nilaparvata lugens]
MNFLVFLFFLSVILVANGQKPNIVLFLTDDQDELLGGIVPMGKTQRLIANKGVIFSNSFVSTPLCCPSRSSILTGRYAHNHGTFNNSINGGCNSHEWQTVHEKNTFAVHLQKNGYRTFYAGKYLNKYGTGKNGSHIPPGWDWWFGLHGNSVYYNYTLSVNGTNHYFTDQYLTKVIKNYGLEFLKSQSNLDQPFLMVLATPAPHEPFTPEDQYKGHFKGVKTKHWLTRMLPEVLPDDLISKLDQFQEMRWETLLSVDDLVESLIEELEKKLLLNNTYVIFTSDNGFHLGQFGLPWDKRQMYETDIRVPLIVRGPNIPEKKLMTSPVVNVDIAGTILDMAGVRYDLDSFDGLSFLPIANTTLPDSRHRSIVIEYRGESNSIDIDPQCEHLIGDYGIKGCHFEAACKCQDSHNNTYNCLRKISDPDNFIYCEFVDSEYFAEFYNLVEDPYQLNNLAHKIKETTSHERVHQLQEALTALSLCRGINCHKT